MILSEGQIASLPAWDTERRILPSGTGYESDKLRYTNQIYLNSSSVHRPSYTNAKYVWVVKIRVMVTFASVDYAQVTNKSNLCSIHSRNF